MSTLLLRFARPIVYRLVDQGLLGVREGQADAVVAHVARTLATRSGPVSLVSSLSQALIDCDDVEELYADVDEIKTLIDGLDAAIVRR